MKPTSYCLSYMQGKHTLSKIWDCSLPILIDPHKLWTLDVDGTHEFKIIHLIENESYLQGKLPIEGHSITVHIPKCNDQFTIFARRTHSTYQFQKTNSYSALNFSEPYKPFVQNSVQWITTIFAGFLVIYSLLKQPEQQPKPIEPIRVVNLTSSFREHSTPMTEISEIIESKGTHSPQAPSTKSTVDSLRSLLKQSSITQKTGNNNHASKLGAVASNAGPGGQSNRGVSGGLSGSQEKSFIAGSVDLNHLAQMNEEGLTKEEVGKVIYQHINEVRYCYESAILHAPEIAGRLDIQFKINGLGRVEQSKSIASTLQSPKLEECIIKKLVSWQFPKPKGSVSVEVAYPFIFKTVGR